MANIYDDINAISTAVYGKEMRPAIVDALTSSKQLADVLYAEASNLRDRIDAISDGGGTDPDYPDNPEVISGDAAGMIVRIMNGAYTNTCYAGLIEEM